MQTNKFLIPFIFIFLVISACTSSTPKKPEITEPISATLNETETYLPIKSSRGENIIESLYKEVLAKNVPLQKLETEIEAINAKNKGGEYAQFNAIHNYKLKSNEYYNEAGFLANQITDSTLRKKLLTILENSKELAAQKIKSHTDLMTQITENQNNIHNQHLVMKVLLTLPIIEKYQTENIPDKKELEDFEQQQKSLILKMENMAKQWQ